MARKDLKFFISGILLSCKKKKLKISREEYSKSIFDDFLTFILFSCQEVS